MDMILNISISNMNVVLIVISIVVLLLGIVSMFLTVNISKKKKNKDYHVINDDEITVYISSYRGRPMKELYISRTYVRKNDKWILSPQYAMKVKFYLKSMWIILAVWAVLTILFLINALSHFSLNECAIAFVISMVFIILIILPGYSGIYYDYYICRKYLKKHSL